MPEFLNLLEVQKINNLIYINLAKFYYSMFGEAQQSKIDQNRQSRQLAVYGHKIQAKLMAMRVFIHGITGLGIQIAKNLILAGPKQVTIYDTSICSINDSGRNFYISQKHINKMTRAEASLKYLKQLNPNVNVRMAQDDKIENIVSQHNCVVVIDNFDKNYLIKLNQQCRTKNIGFIYGGNLGLYGFTFVDFGDKHEVLDATGEQQRSIHIELITKQNQGVILLNQGKKHGLNDGDTVTFKQVQGMTQLNGKIFQVKVISPSSFSIGDTSKFSDYKNGGIATQVKIPFFQKYNSLQKSLIYPYAPGSKQMPICNWQNFGVPEQLHAILNGLLQYFSRHKQLPQILNKENAIQLQNLCKQWQKNRGNEKQLQFNVQINKKFIDFVSMYAKTQISPICSFWGGIITQQIIKKTGKYSPIRQWLHHQFCEILQKQGQFFKNQISKLAYLNTRYADYNILFGNQFVQKMSKTNTFLVGAGALGCQFIKMFALMGMSTHQKSRIICTDDDNIEISNLNRQFLFRKNHVGRNKSQTACHIGRKINKNCRFQSVKLKVSPQTQQYFNDQFWQNQNLIVNAVDNVKARQFIDNKCVWYEKPLFESGTLGTKCHSQIIIPHLSISYNDIIDPPELQFAVCTLKLFPYQIQHTIQWAREYFETIIVLPIADLHAFYQNKNNLLDRLLKQNKRNMTIGRQKLQRMKLIHEINQSQSYLKCVQLAVRAFEDAFQNQIAQLLCAFPQDYISPINGKAYWSGLKRAPQIIKLDSTDKLHIQFIQSASNIIAISLSIPEVQDKDKIIQMIEQIPGRDYVHKKILKIDEGSNDDNAIQYENSELQQNDLTKLMQNLLQIECQKYKTPRLVAFEKDDPTNWHIQFMGSVANLRARNYRIQEVDNFKVKLIAGKIIPAIATTTALIVGVVGIQIIKYVLEGENKAVQNYYRNANINLASQFFVFSDITPAIEIKDKEMDLEMGEQVRAIPSKFTKWDKLVIKSPMTLKQLIQEYQQKFDIKIESIVYNGSVNIYSQFQNSGKSKERLGMSIQEAVEDASQKKIGKHKKYLMLQVYLARDKQGIFCLLPDIKYVM